MVPTNGLSPSSLAACVPETRKFRGSLTGISIGGTVTETQKIWRIFQALVDIVFAYAYSIILIEIQDIGKSPLTEAKTMKATLLSVAMITLFYMFCRYMGYAAFGDLAPSPLKSPHRFWILNIANATIVIVEVFIFW